MRLHCSKDLAARRWNQWLRLLTIAIRLSALKDLASYLYPKRKAVELNASVSVLSHEEALAYLEAD
jgi:uncharacterized membrane protein YhfC